MRKKHNFRDVSERRCKNCGKRLKLNLLEKKPAAKLCYACHHAQDMQRRGVGRKKKEVVS